MPVVTLLADGVGKKASLRHVDLHVDFTTKIKGF
jgi:hypothetical protein